MRGPILPPLVLSGDGVIDNVYSMENEHDFVDVSLDPTLGGGEDGMSTTQELIRCKKTVLIFYLNFLKVVYNHVYNVHVYNGKSNLEAHSACEQVSSLRKRCSLFLNT